MAMASAPGASNTAKETSDAHRGRSADSSDSSDASDDERDMENASDDGSDHSDGSNGSDDSDTDVEIPVGAKVPSVEDLGLGEAAKRHVANMSFNEAQKWLWGLSHMSQYDRECVVKRISSKSALSVIATNGTPS